MKKTFVVAVMLICFLTGCSSEIEPTTVTEKPVSTEEKAIEPAPTVVYADNKVVNEFINIFNEKSEYDITDISKGNIRTKYHCYINGHWIELLSYSEGLSVSINGGQDDVIKQSMFDVLDEVLRAADETLSDDKRAEVIDYLKAEEYMVSDYSVSDNITIETYVPIVEQSYGKTTCRVDLILHHYK